MSYLHSLGELPYKIHFFIQNWDLFVKDCSHRATLYERPPTSISQSFPTVFSMPSVSSSLEMFS